MNSFRLPHRFAPYVSLMLCALSGVVAPCAAAVPAPPANRAAAPWRIESFCHRGAPPAHRCLVRARQGIIVFELAELPAPPAMHWSDGVAVLTSGTDETSRQLRFYVPPQQLSAPFEQVRAYDTQQQLVAVVTDRGVHLRAMFPGGHARDERDLATLALPADIGIDTLQLHIDGRSLHASWHDRQGHTQEQTLTAGH